MNLDVNKVLILMAEKRFTVKELAKAARITESLINLWLKHGRKPHLDKIGALAAALDVSVIEIVE